MDELIDLFGKTQTNKNEHYAKGVMEDQPKGACSAYGHIAILSRLVTKEVQVHLYSMIRIYRVDGLGLDLRIKFRTTQAGSLASSLWSSVCVYTTRSNGNPRVPSKVSEVTVYMPTGDNLPRKPATSA